MSDISVEIQGARSYCDLVHVEWPYAEDVVWLQLEGKDKRWKVTQGEVETVTEGNEEIGALLARTFFLTSLKKKLVELGLKYFNVCQSVPSFISLTKFSNWPGPHDKVRKLWISPSAGEKTAIIELMDTIFDLWRDESLIIYGFPMVLDFCLNVLYVIGHLFTKVGLVNPRGPTTIVLFHEFQKLNLLDSKLLKSIKSMVNENNDLGDLSILPNTSYYESQFYECSVYMSSILMKEQVLDILSNIDTATANKNVKDLNWKEDPKPKQQVAKVNADYVEIERCQSPDCSACKLPGSKGVLACERMKDELKQLLIYVQDIDIRWPAEDENVIWLDFSGQTYPSVETVKRQCSYKVFHLEEVSKVCAKQLLQCQRRLCYVMKKGFNLTNEDTQKGSCLHFDVEENLSTQLKSYDWSTSPLEVRVLDFGRELWINIEDHVSLQHSTLLKILDALDDTWRDECLELRGFPLLSEFNISIVFVLGHFFKKVGLLHPSSFKNVIFFNNFQYYPRNIKKFLEDALLEDDVLSLVPLKNIFCGEFYECVRASNNLSLKKQCLKILHSCNIGDGD